MPQTNRSRTSSGKMRPTNIVHQHPPLLHSSPPILHPSSSPLLVELASSAKDISNPLPDHSSLSQSAGKVSNPSSPSPNAHPKVQWCADSGASSHMTPHRNWFEDYEPWIVPVRVANGTLLKSAGIGSVSFTPILNGSPARRLVFHRVLHVPDLTTNLLSVLHLTAKKGFTVTIHKDGMNFEK